jgi:hypothetical protein
MPAAPGLALLREPSRTSHLGASPAIHFRKNRRTQGRPLSAQQAGGHNIMATKAYRPANGMEGAIFMTRFCDQCEHDRSFRESEGDSCPIAAATMAFAVTDPEYPKEWIEDEGGVRCTAFEQESA